MQPIKLAVSPSSHEIKNAGCNASTIFILYVSHSCGICATTQKPIEMSP
eukprot:CAMPEP_0198352810 /NCGR_PEP_ID=MMETSP1450-20131203/108773_1 /TAXON_ID=753684 ORGANISM="Madagascaria erythrocladiodes, Strain CCMP3234" /NCGR_SAMPLE_ID=MMETSP1450 /ASSEMBLY_ACC=CAM_ASM_001115 /LENGTH=48 /DNA_ID= /DNA_START= /DNA_END= /DNA_ORIENTATION=